MKKFSKLKKLFSRKIVVKKGVLLYVSPQLIAEDGKFIVPNGVKKISSHAFEECLSDLTEVILPDSVTEIEINAFRDAPKLKNVHLGNKLQVIGQNAFSGCSKLTQIELPSSLKLIDKFAFARTSLNNVVVPDSVDAISSWCFSECIYLESVMLPEHLKTIDSCAFEGCKSLKGIDIPSGVTEIKTQAFSKTGLEEIVCPSGLIKLYDGVFYDCKKLKRVVLPNSITEISYRTFSRCESLQEIILPDSIESIKNSAFEGCNGLKRVVLPKNLKNIGSRTFAFCKNLEGIILPDSLLELGAGAFLECLKLKNIIIPSKIQTIPSSCFSGCKELTNLVIGDGVKYIEDHAFSRCDSLTKCNLPLGVKSVHSNSFNNNVALYVQNKELTQEQKANISSCIEFIIYAIKNNKFIPTLMEIVNNTGGSEIANFYKHSKRWELLYKTYVKAWMQNYNDDNKGNLKTTLGDLYKIAVVCGLFQDGKIGERAESFLHKYIVQKQPEEIHRMYGGLLVKQLGFNSEFAEFYITGYIEHVNAKRPNNFMEIEDGFFYGENILNLVHTAYNNWNKVKQAYPNKTVLAHREKESENNTLTIEDVLNALILRTYDHADSDNSDMVMAINKYGYTQQDFETLQKWWNIGKKIDPEKMILRAGRDPVDSGVTFELLAKNNPEGLIIGELTNCCQVIRGLGESCVKYGVTKLNSGFVKFMINGKIVGQSWVWYNKKTKSVCLDNIEIPTIWQKAFKNIELRQSFIKCIKRLALSFKQEMEKAGYMVDRVTIGQRNNDIELDDFKRVRVFKRVLPADYNGYTDTAFYEYVVKSLENVKE